MNISYKLNDLRDKKITKIETMQAEYGRTYNRYLCFTCDDGTRVMLYGGEPCFPEPKIEEMRKIDFFTPEEIGNKLTKIETEKRKRQEEIREQKKRELEKLKHELGEE